MEGVPLIQEYDSPANFKLENDQHGGKVMQFRALMHHESIHHMSVNSRAQITTNSRESIQNPDLDAITAKFDIESNVNRERLNENRQLNMFQSFQDPDTQQSVSRNQEEVFSFVSNSDS